MTRVRTVERGRMSGVGRSLLILQWVSLLSMIIAIVMGYVARWHAPAVGPHIWTGFLFALIIGFTHSMTLFYFAGMGVSMRQAARGRAAFASHLERASILRRRLATPLGLALVTMMAATILGGGSHTTMLPSWPHHVISIAALGSHLWAARVALRSIRDHESVIASMNVAIETGG